MSPWRKGLAAAVIAVVAAPGLTAAGANAGGADGRSPRAQAASYRGVRVPIADAPWMASILPLDARLRAAKALPGYALRCSAAVIGPRLVLTAAHCVSRFDIALIETAKPLGVPALPLADERPRVSETVSSFGFGRDGASFDGDAASRLLLRRVDSVVGRGLAQATRAARS